MTIRYRLMAGAAAVAAITSATLIVGTPAAADVTPADGTALAATLTAAGGPVTGASYVSVPDGTPNGVSNAGLAGFPTQGSTFAILTTGDVNSALLAPPSTSDGTGTELVGADHVRGDTDNDVTILKIDFTAAAGMNCVRFDFRFLSEEFPEFLGTQYNDAFIAELDTLTWATSGSDITAPGNFAFDPSHEPISINAAGFTSMSAGPSDTTYDGATPVLTAATTVTEGPHSLYLSIFDQGDERYDSAVLLDNLVVGHAADADAQCAPGAAPKQFDLSLNPPAAENELGTSHTVTATLLNVAGAPVNGAPIVFTVSGANTASGTATTNASGTADFTYAGANAGDDTITACHDVNGDGACGAGEAFASVNKTWKAVPTRGISLADTGAPVGTIVTVGAACVVVGAAFILLVRRRRVVTAGPTTPDSATEE